MGKAILYLRVSSKEQLEGSSIETQERICVDYALRNGFEIEKIFTEKGESAKTTDRTELKAMLDYVDKKSNSLDVVIIYKVDRLARNTLDHAQLKLFFQRFGVKLISATENLEDTPVGRLIENQLAGFAQFDNEVRAERCISGMIAAVKAGRYVWKAPIGYVNVGGRGNSNIAQDNLETVRLVRKSWELIDNGFIPEEARKMVTEEGLVGKNGKPISKSHFHQMIRNKIYMGTVEKFGLRIVGHFKPIVEEDLFLRVMVKLDRKARTMPIYKKDNEDFPLRSLVKCSHCGEFMTASWSKGRNKKYAYYRCVHCQGVNIKKDDLESKFIALLRKLNYKPELKELLAKAIEINLEHRTEANRKKVTTLEKKIIELKAKEKQIAEKNFKGVINDILAKSMLDENEKDKSDIMLELHKYKDTQGNIMDIVRRSLSLLEDISEVWLKVELDIKKRFQKFLFPEGLPYDGVNFGTTKLALCIEENWRLEPQKFALVNVFDKIRTHFKSSC